MDLKTIGQAVAPFAPALGSIVGGFIPFPGGSMIGKLVGEMVANAFGVNPASPTAGKEVSDRIFEAGEETARAKLAAVTEQARIQVEGFVAYERAVLEAQVKNLSDVNATIRAEAAVPPAQREHWFFRAWRPAFGWAFIATWSAFGLMLTAVTARAAWLAPDPLTVLKDAWPLFLAYFGPGAAVLGVLIPSRSYEKGEAMKAGIPMPNAKPPVPTTGSGVKPAAPIVVKPAPSVTRPVTARADG